MTWPLGAIACRPILPDFAEPQPRASSSRRVVRSTTTSSCTSESSTRPNLLVMPAGGLPGALRAADAIVHIRLTRVVGTRLIGPSESRLTTEHVGLALSVLKGGAADLVPGAPVHFWQSFAGSWVEDGRQLVGERPPYQVDDEFVGLFRREPDAKLVEFVAGRFMFRVVGGKVAWPHAPSSGIQDGMSVNAFMAALRQLMAGGQRGLS